MIFYDIGEKIEAYFQGKTTFKGTEGSKKSWYRKFSPNYAEIGINEVTIDDVSNLVRGNNPFLNKNE